MDRAPAFVQVAEEQVVGPTRRSYIGLAICAVGYRQQEYRYAIINANSNPRFDFSKLKNPGSFGFSPSGGDQHPLVEDVNGKFPL
jgi:hypothetical protein